MASRTDKLRSFVYPPWPLLFSLAAAGLLLSAWTSISAVLPEVCGSNALSLVLDSGGAGRTLFLALNPPSALATSWTLMLVAMMPPLLAMPLTHVWRSTMARYRGRAVACFILGYGAAWLSIGPVLVALALLLRFMGGSFALILAVAIALVWSASPWQRLALNRSHRFGRIGVFGWARYRDSLSFGAGHAGWCIASCWAWMIVPLTAGAWHIAAMGVTGIIMLQERLKTPDRPAWRLPVSVADIAGLLAARTGIAARG